MVLIALLTLVTEWSLSRRPLETLNNGVFDSVKQTLVHLDTKGKHMYVKFIYQHNSQEL